MKIAIYLPRMKSVAQEVYLSTGSHDFSHLSLPLVVARLKIGEEAFIGARAFVMPGVKIGARAIVGPCSVVTKDVPEIVIAAGNPRRVLFSGESKERLTREAREPRRSAQETS